MEQPATKFLIEVTFNTLASKDFVIDLLESDDDVYKVKVLNQQDITINVED